jgi:alpha-ketoglutarate-dependent taurine dioxygenase
MLVAEHPRTWTEAPDCGAVQSLAQALDSHGAVRVRGCSPHDLVAVSEALGHGFIVHGSPLRQATAIDPTVKTVDGGTHAIDFHCELAYLPVHLALVVFYCDHAPSRGGETLLADGVAIAASLRPATRALLMRHRLRYEHHVPAALWPLVWAAIEDEPLRPGESFTVLGKDADGRVVAEYLTPALVAAREGDPPAFANSVLASLDPSNAAARDLYRLSLEDGTAISHAVVEELRSRADAAEVALRWQPGELVLVDNHRVLHGRRAFEGRREILTRFARRRRPTGGSPT